MINKKSLILLVFTSILFLSFASADLSVSKEDKGSIVIAELNNPAIFEFTINNSDSPDSFEIYSLLSVSMSPKGTFALLSGSNKLEVKAYPSEEIREKVEGFYNFEYQIKSMSSSYIFKDTLRVKIVPLKNILEIKPVPLQQNSPEEIITVRNTENAHLYDLKIHFDSVFFESDGVVSLEPYESKNITVSVNLDKTKKLLAGPYVVTADVQYNDAKTRLNGILKYLEKEGTSVMTEHEGFIVRKTIITKTNEGNVETRAKVEVKRDIITRLVTINSLEPTRTERKGLFVYYTWERELKPTESIIVSTTTNYTFPFILAILVVFVALLAKIYSNTALVVTKRVSFVKTKGGEFALKVRLCARAKEHVDKIQLIDSLPGLTKLYEKFGNKPDRIDGARRLFWNLGSLNAGEERVLSYIIYSKMSVTGRFELPAATAVFQKDGKNMEVWSNRTFFVAETARGDAY
ncbi:MAG: hypothetical protein Q8L29_02395 [archaeon]|nr:hypothetical protein [archaeon]